MTKSFMALVLALYGMRSMAEPAPGTAAALPDPGQLLEDAAKPVTAPQTLTFRQFVQLTQQVNQDLAAQQLNVPIAEAQVSVARITPNPGLTAGIDSKELSSQRPAHRPPTTYTYGLTQTVELGGKRTARVAVAKAGVDLATASLLDYRRGLRSAAALAFITVLKGEQALTIQQQSLQALERLAEINTEKQKRGAATEVAVAQARVELERARNGLTATQAALDEARADLLSYVGDAESYRVHPPRLVGTLHVQAPEFNFDQALVTATAQRSDIQVAQKALDVAERQIALAQSSRWVDVDVAANIRRTAESRAYTDTDGNTVGPAPLSNVLGLTLTVPLPFSTLERGAMQAAFLARDQARLQLLSTQRAARVELLQAFTTYSAAREQLARFDAGVIDNARKVLDATLYSYERGGASVLELLEARRADAETQLEYLDALAGVAAAWVCIEQAQGTWNVNF